MQVPKLEENQQTLQHLQQERLLYFECFRNNVSLYCIKQYMDGFYTSRYFQQYQEHPNRSSYDKVMVLGSWRKNRGLQQRRDVENQRRDVAETEHPDVATLQKQSIPTSRRSGSILGGFLAHFDGDTSRRRDALFLQHRDVGSQRRDVVAVPCFCSNFVRP